jgi:hypothetical protein
LLISCFTGGQDEQLYVPVCRAASSYRAGDIERRIPEQIAIDFYRTVGRPIPADGVDPLAVCVIRLKGNVEVGVGGGGSGRGKPLPEVMEVRLDLAEHGTT